MGGQTGVSIVCSSIILPLLPEGQNRHITTLCDGLSALETVGRPTTNIKAKHKHSDLISLTSAVWESSQFTMTKEHVKAHQDDLPKILNVKESLNCKMDILAKDIALQHMLSSQKLSFATTSLGF